jgi:hypothetical protein
MEPVRIAAYGAWIVGFIITALGLVAMIRSIRDVAARLVALGITYSGMFVVIGGGGLLYLLALMGDGHLPVLADIPIFAVVGITAIRIRLGTSRAFAEARKVKTE